VNVSPETEGPVNIRLGTKLESATNALAYCDEGTIYNSKNVYGRGSGKK
jgi:hypothetical protein